MSEDSMIHKAFAESGKLMDLTYNWLKFRNPNPYDAEVDWISPSENSSGKSDAYIPLDFVPTNNTFVNAEFSITTIYPTIHPWYLFGRTTHNSNNRCQICRSNVSTKPLDIGMGATYKDTEATAGDFVIEMDFANGKATVNGTEQTGYSVTAAGMGDAKINIFKRQLTDDCQSQYVRLKRLKFYDGGTLVCDFIPVRVGQIGYLYDKVSGQLFGNAGSGSFVLGPDIVPIEYLESTGTQYIDTGFTAKTDTTRAEMLIVPSGNTTAGVFGSRDATSANGYSCNAFLISGSTPYFRWDWVAGNSSTRTNCTIGDEYRISITAGSVTANGITTTASPNRLQQSYPFYIFTFANASTDPFTPTFYGKVKWFQIYDSDVLVRDYIPVRVGQIGYLYDKVSGNLFGNSGTGDFVLGPDKV